MKNKFITLSMVIALVLNLGLFTMPLNADPGPGIVAQWHFDGNTNDSSGNGNNGAVLEYPSYNIIPGTYISGKFNQALSLDGVNDFFYKLNTPSLNFDVGAWEAWVSFDKLPSEIATPSYPTISIMNKTGASPFPQYWIHATSVDSFVVGVRVDSTSYLVNSPPGTIQTGQWYHVMGTYDGETLKIIVNDSFVAVNEMPSGIISQGSGSLSIGIRVPGYLFFNGAIDEVRIWNTPYPDYNLGVTPLVDTNPVDTNHEVAATVSINKVGGGTELAPGVKVTFTFHSTSPNADEGTKYRLTDSCGQAVINYPGDGGSGIDNILVWIDRDFSGTFDENTDIWKALYKSWVGNYVTGGGKVNVENGKKAGWTFAGTAGMSPGGGIEGQFEIVDHTNQVTYYLSQFIFLYFAHSVPGASAESPEATNDVAVFMASGIDSNGMPVTIRVTIVDLDEPGAGIDMIGIDRITAYSPPTWPISPVPSIELLPLQTIDGGNFQVHNTN